MAEMKPLIIKGKKIKFPIIQGGMSIGISQHYLTRAVADEGGFGVIGGAALNLVLQHRDGKKRNIYEAVREEISLAKEDGKLAGINLMRAVDIDYVDSVKAAIDVGVDAIISGAGLPINLPSICNPRETALIPIVSSARALEIIIKKWEKVGYRPDAVILEGPLAGGHLGFKFSEVEKEKNKLENLFPAVKEAAMKNGDFPVIVAGGIYSHEDIIKFLKMGANGVQLGIRFLATNESSADYKFKMAVIGCSQDDIEVSRNSPCGLPFRIIRQSPAVICSKYRPTFCNRGYVLQKDSEGKYAICPAKEDNKNFFCICNALLSATGIYTDKESPAWTVGETAWRINKLLSVKELMDRLKGLVFDD